MVNVLAMLKIITEVQYAAQGVQITTSTTNARAKTTTISSSTCADCTRDHSASFKGCSAYNIAKEMTLIKTNDGLSYAATGKKLREMVSTNHIRFGQPLSGPIGSPGAVWGSMYMYNDTSHSNQLRSPQSLLTSGIKQIRQASDIQLVSRSHNIQSASNSLHTMNNNHSLTSQNPHTLQPPLQYKSNADT